MLFCYHFVCWRSGGWLIVREFACTRPWIKLNRWFIKCVEKTFLLDMRLWLLDLLTKIHYHRQSGIWKCESHMSAWAATVAVVAACGGGGQAKWIKTWAHVCFVETILRYLSSWYNFPKIKEFAHDKTHTITHTLILWIHIGNAHTIIIMILLRQKYIASIKFMWI